MAGAACLLFGAALLSLDVAEKILGCDDGLYGRPSFLIATRLIVLGVQVLGIALLVASVSRLLARRR